MYDFKPRKFDAEQCNVLCNFAEMTVREIQRITESSMQRSMSMNLENEQLLRSIDDCSDGVVLLDVRIPRWPVLFSNEGWSHLTGSSIAARAGHFSLPCVSPCPDMLPACLLFRGFPSSKEPQKMQSSCAIF